jgi:putative salt-induced outer membrane protein YdiY
VTIRPSRATGAAPTISFIGLLWFHAALGDEVVMANGDRLTGRILQTDPDTVLLETDYAGIITIEHSQVRFLHHAAAQARTRSVEPPDAGPSTVADEPKPNERQRAAAPPAEESSMPAHAESGKASAFTPGSKLSGRVNLALSSKKGNTDQNEVDIDYEIGYRGGWHRLGSIGEIELDTNRGEIITDNWSTYNRYSRHFPSRWYGGVWLALRHDRFADLRLRTLVGPALGYLAFESEAINLSVEAGPMVLRDDFYGQPDQDFLGSGWFLNYDQLVWDDRLQPYHRQFGYVAFDGQDKRLWKSWTGLRVPLAGGFTGSVELEYDYDSDPAVEAETTDTTVRLKLGYQW